MMQENEKFEQRIWSTWNWTLYNFLRENMQAGISNMENIHELMFWNKTCVFRVYKTTVLIQKTSIFNVCTKARISCILTKFAWKYHKIMPPICIRYFSNCHRVQILDWSPEFCNSADFLGQNEKKSENHHQKINIPPNSVFWIRDS